MNRNIISLIFALLISWVGTQVVLSNDFTVHGYVRYWDITTQSYRPLAGAELHYYNPNGLLDYTDQQGFYQHTFSGNTDYITVYVFFRNSKIDLRGATTTRSDSYSYLSMNGNLNGSVTLDYNITGAFANYARVFTIANKAADFTIAQGYTPPQAIIKYPAEESILNGVTVSVNLSFFYPFGTVSTDNLGFLTPIIDFLGHSGEITGQGVYLTQSEVNANHEATIYHEYGHFVMWAKRGDWPISFQDYTSGVSMTHSWDEQTQNIMTAFVEGWADFYSSAVQSWLFNPSSPYSGRYVDENGSDPYPIFRTPRKDSIFCQEVSICQRNESVENSTHNLNSMLFG
jgi:hypothetical protein